MTHFKLLQYHSFLYQKSKWKKWWWKKKLLILCGINTIVYASSTYTVIWKKTVGCRWKNIWCYPRVRGLILKHTLGARLLIAVAPMKVHHAFEYLIQNTKTFSALNLSNHLLLYFWYRIYSGEQKNVYIFPWHHFLDKILIAEYSI